MKHTQIASIIFAIVLVLLTACGTEQPPPTPTRVPTETQPPLSGVRVSTLPPPASDTPAPAAATATPVPAALAPSATAGCVLQAAFIADVTIPDGSVVAPGSQLVKTWRVKNSGTCDWGNGLKAVFVEGDQLGGASVVSLEPVDAGRTLDIAIALKAPANPGAYRGKWQLRAPNGTVLTGLTVSIVISATPTPTSSPAPTGPPTTTPKPSPVPTFAGTMDSFVGLWWNTSDEVVDVERIQQVQIRKSGNRLEASAAATFDSKYSFGLMGFVPATYDGGRKLKIEFDDPKLGHVTIEMAINKACNADVRLSYGNFRRGFVFWNRQPPEPESCL